jgi:hypothetical protein
MKHWVSGLALVFLLLTGQAQTSFSNSAMEEIIVHSYSRLELEKIARACLNFPLTNTEKLIILAGNAPINPERRIKSEMSRPYTDSILPDNHRVRRLDSDIVRRINRYQSIIRSCCQTHQLDENLVKAVIYVESGGNPRALSNKGAMGLMQLMPYNLNYLGVRLPFIPLQNIQGGTRLLSILYRYFDQDEFYVLWAYHAGMQRVDSGIMPEETRHYIVNVKRIQNLYRLKGEGKNA